MDKQVDIIERVARDSPEAASLPAIPEPGSLELNPDQYREHLSEFELTKDQENELLQVLWNIMSTMVDIGWGVDTVQMFLPDLFEKAGSDSNQTLETNTPPFNALAADHANRKDDADE